MVQGQAVTQFAPKSEVSKAMIEAWKKVRILVDSLPEKD
jgi:hypothetical protein